MRITAATRVYGIIGDPVAHSLSPVMQNAAFAAAGLDCVYVTFHVPGNRLREAVEGMRALGVQGFNVTVPHKVAVLPLLDEVSPEAAAIGAVNTVKLQEGRLLGYNTDGRGFLRSLDADLGFRPEGRDIVVLGAGGAARAAVHSLCGCSPRRVVVANRTPSRAADLVAALRPLFPGVPLESCALSGGPFGDALSGANLLVNTTSASLSCGGPVADLTLLPPGCAVYDMVYGETPLVRQARERDLRAADGLGMLVGQGEIAFSIWTGLEPPAGLMMQALRPASCD
ncbi:MAG TPA: shikimate dehydrogenase [Verrucomicrobiae bacterium]|nr:shikimate dehydrogenase [Verrucomicrobiae bacterium]